MNLTVCGKKKYTTDKDLMRFVDLANRQKQVGAIFFKKALVYCRKVGNNSWRFSEKK